MQHSILFVDDEPNFLDAVKRSLRKEDYLLFCASSASDAFGVLKERPIDLVISDQEMPGMQGTEFLRQVRDLYPETVRFMLTGKATLEVAVAAINDGAIARFLTKPCNAVDLAVTIRLALQHKDLLANARRLLVKVREQERVLERMENQSPGITRVDRDATGAIVLDNATEDFDSFMREIGATLGTTS